MCSFLVWKNACLNYRELDLEGDLVGVPHTWNLSAQSFITLIKLVWREYDIVAMNEWKKKCVGLQRTWVSKRTVCLLYIWRFPYCCWSAQLTVRSLMSVAMMECFQVLLAIVKILLMKGVYHCKQCNPQIAMLVSDAENFVRKILLSGIFSKWEKQVHTFHLLFIYIGKK